MVHRSAKCAVVDLNAAIRDREGAPEGNRYWKEEVNRRSQRNGGIHVSLWLQRIFRTYVATDLFRSKKMMASSAKIDLSIGRNAPQRLCLLPKIGKFQLMIVPPNIFS